MATKTKTRTRTKAPAAEAQPAPQTAPEPAAVTLEGPGFRTPDVWSPRDRNPRPAGELSRTATLVRGNVYVFSYSTGPIFFRHGKATPINDTEFKRLSEQVDRVDFPDPSSGVRIERAIRKFIFADNTTGEAIKMPAIPDREVGPLALSLGDQAQRDALFEGQEHTRR